MIDLVPMIGPDFTLLERSILLAICEMHAEDQSALAAQLSAAIVQSRENTGAGFFTNFEVKRKACMAIGGKRLRSGPEARIKGLEHGMGFILWLKEGYANCLEGYCYASESTSQISLETISFEIVRI